MKISKKLQLLFLSLIVLSCGGTAEDNGSADETQEENLYGGIFKMPIGSYFVEDVKVNEIQKLETSQIYLQIFEGLVRYNSKTLEIEPALASDWSVSSDGLTYKFNLRDEVYFHDNACFKDGKGRKVVAEDVMYSLTSIFDPKMTNNAYSIFKNTIVGGDEYHDGNAETISGISVSGNEINVELLTPSLAFIKKLASIYGAIVPKESDQIEDWTPVGTGPFVFDDLKTNSECVQMARNENYYGKDAEGNQLPYLDSVIFTYYEDKEEQMELFWGKDLSYIPKVPITKVSEVLEERIGDFESKPPKYILNSEPILKTTYLGLNMQTPVLKNKKVRQALNHAINRKKLVEKILKNQAYETGKFGITPPLPKLFDDYDFEGVEDTAYTYNPEKAKQLLAEAGYPDGKNFPSLEMEFNTGSTEYLIASEIQNQVRSVLKINIDIEALEFNQRLENKAIGKADIFRSNWIADYPTPETFLANAYGKVVPKSKDEPSYLNSSRYQNAAFDELFEKAISSTDPKEANRAFSEAEKILMDDAVFIILWYGEDLALKQASLRNFETNSISYISLKDAYFKTPTAEEFANK